MPRDLYNTLTALLTATPLTYAGSSEADPAPVEAVRLKRWQVSGKPEAGAMAMLEKEAESNPDFGPVLAAFGGHTVYSVLIPTGEPSAYELLIVAPVCWHWEGIRTSVIYSG